MSESGPHHSWTADHLLSFPKLQLDSLSHLSVLRIVPPPHFSLSSNVLEYDSRIDDVATLKPIPKDIVAVIRGTSALTVLECDWWSWKPEDVKSLLERCTQLEVMMTLLLFILLLKLCFLLASQVVVRRAIQQTFNYDFGIHSSDSTPQALSFYTPRACLGTYSSPCVPSIEVIFSSFNTCCFTCPSSNFSSTPRP